MTKLDTLERKAFEKLGLSHLLEEEKPPSEKDLLKSREAEATIKYLERKEIFIERDCKFCERRFAVDLANVAYCSDDCRIKRLHEMGIRWNPEKSQSERWNGPLVVLTELEELPQEMIRIEAERLANIPLVVPPDALEKCESLADHVVEETVQESPSPLVDDAFLDSLLS